MIYELRSKNIRYLHMAYVIVRNELHLISITMRLYNVKMFKHFGLTNLYEYVLVKQNSVQCLSNNMGTYIIKYSMLKLKL